MTRGELRSTPVPAGVLSVMMSGTHTKPLSSVTCLGLQGNVQTTITFFQVTDIKLKFQPRSMRGWGVGVGGGHFYLNFFFIMLVKIF